MKKYRKISFALVLSGFMAITLAGCSDTALQEELDNLKVHSNELQAELDSSNEHVTLLEEEIAELKEELFEGQSDQFPPVITYGYLGDNPDFYVYVEYESYIKMLPYDSAMDVNIVFANSLVKVLDKVQLQTEEEINNDRYWYYVEVTVYDTPMNTKGWIRVEKTEPYTAQNQQDVISPVAVKDGSRIYEESSPLDDENAPYSEAESLVGMIEAYQDDYVMMSTAGGSSFWTKSENLVYPEIK